MKSDISPPSMPHMEKEGIALLKTHLKKTRIYLEYGSGGSTFLAAQHGVSSIHSIDSDPNFLEAVQEKVSRSYPLVKLNTYHANIGPTKEWGVPLDRSMLEYWPSYSITAWKELLATQQQPDLILIDGRFRIACFLASLIFSKPKTVILFDDYYDRPHYHEVEKHLKPSSRAGRMAEFIVDMPTALPQIILDLIPASTSFH